MEIGKRKESNRYGEFKEALYQWLLGWGQWGGIGERVCNYHEMENYAQEEENQVNNDIGESQIAGRPYKLTQ